MWEYIGLSGAGVRDGLSLTLRELGWMAQARRRDQWDQFAQLLSLIDHRSGFGEDFKPRTPLEYFPPELDTDAERRAVWKAKRREQSLNRGTVKDVCEMMGLGPK